jgi:hypothetical protein
LRPARVAVLKTAALAFAAVFAGGLNTIKGKVMKIILQSIIAVAAVYVLVTFGTAAFSPRGSSASTSGDQMAAQQTVQFLNHLDEIAAH